MNSVDSDEATIFRKLVSVTTNQVNQLRNVIEGNKHCHIDILTVHEQANRESASKTTQLFHF